MHSHARVILALVGAAAVLALAPNLSAATSSADLLLCQKKIEKHARAFSKVVGKKIQKCSEKIDACKLANEIDGADLTSCVTAATPTCTAVDAAIIANRATRKMAIDKVCSLIPLADVEPFLGSLGFVNVAAVPCSAVSVVSLTDCLLDQTRCTAEKEVFRRDPRALDALTAASVNMSFPCVGP